jgi:hypothetical protein
VDALLSHIGGTKGRVSNITYQSLNAFSSKLWTRSQDNTENEAIDPEDGFLETVPRDFLLQAFFH